MIEYPSPYERLVLDYKKANIDSIQKALDQINLRFLFSNESVHQQVKFLDNTLMNVFSNFIPNKLVTFRVDLHTQVATDNGKRLFGGGWVLHGGVILWQSDILGKMLVQYLIGFSRKSLEIKIKIMVNIPILSLTHPVKKILLDFAPHSLNYEEHSYRQSLKQSRVFFFLRVWY